MCIFLFFHAIDHFSSFLLTLLIFPFFMATIIFRSFPLPLPIFFSCEWSFISSFSLTLWIVSFLYQWLFFHFSGSLCWFSLFHASNHFLCFPVGFQSFLLLTFIFAFFLSFCWFFLVNTHFIYFFHSLCCLFFFLTSNHCFVFHSVEYFFQCLGSYFFLFNSLSWFFPQPRIVFSSFSLTMLILLFYANDISSFSR